MPNRFRTVKLPDEMVKHIEILLSKHPEWGYRSMADFVKDSVRHNIDLLSLGKKPEMESTK